ncbi:uncharacterized protein LOC126088178 [Schistocerca cancellata]|uniref:uncharacterized protein LOC126088178 n=1 Tax=Schistocerca cancellata TaxID=274614 RepID=UPI0021192CB8|nr:uncharacterized protein LOC126088178 [Schistocerca cancellata]
MDQKDKNNSVTMKHPSTGRPKNNGVFPGRLKMAVVKLIHQTDRENNIKKILEHYNNADILSDFQHGLRRGQSNTSAAVQCVHHVLKKINETSQAAGVFLDLLRAFYRVHHDVLLSKIAKSGVTGILKQLLETYLKGRQLCMEVIYCNGEILERRSSSDTSCVC